MSLSSQLKYAHEITKDDMITKPRISFNFKLNLFKKYLKIFT